MIALVFGSAFIYNKATKESAVEKLTIFNDPTLDPIEYTTKVDITPITEPVQNTAAAATAPAGAIATTITDNAPEPTTPTNLNTPISGVGTETATGISPVGPETSTITSISVVAAPALPSEVVVVADEMPEFEGGITGLMRYVKQNIFYPTVAREIGVEGIVYVSFVVNESGNVESAKVMKGIGYGCDEEVIRVVGKMPVGQSFNVLGKIGTTYGRTEVSSAPGSGIPAGSDSGFGLSAGLGAEVVLTPNWSGLLQYDIHDLRFAGGVNDRDRIGVLSLGIRYSF